MQDQFPLPDACAYAIPYFETSDILREFALTLGDLVAAYYVRKMGVQICIITCSKLNDNEKAYVEQINNRLVGQLEEMKKLYDVNEIIGAVSYFLGYLISSKCYVRRSNLLIMLVFSIKDVVRVQ